MCLCVFLWLWLDVNDRLSDIEIQTKSRHREHYSDVLVGFRWYFLLLLPLPLGQIGSKASRLPVRKRIGVFQWVRVCVIESIQQLCLPSFKNIRDVVGVLRNCGRFVNCKRKNSQLFELSRTPFRNLHRSFASKQQQITIHIVIDCYWPSLHWHRKVRRRNSEWRTWFWNNLLQSYYWAASLLR